MDITPTPTFTACMYAAIREPGSGWALKFGKGGGKIKKVSRNAPGITDLMNAFERRHPDKAKEFDTLPEGWGDLTESQKKFIATGEW
jgi:hypothetical protein